MEKNIINVIILPGGKQAKEINLVSKPIAGFYDFNDSYDEQAFETAKRKWQEAENKLKTFDVIKVGTKSYPHIAAGIKFWHLIPEKEYQAEIIEEGKIKIIS